MEAYWMYIYNFILYINFCSFSIYITFAPSVSTLLYNYISVYKYVISNIFQETFPTVLCLLWMNMKSEFLLQSFDLDDEDLACSRFIKLNTTITFPNESNK